MSLATYYQHKAEHCERQAAAAPDPLRGGDLRQEGKLWREIARDIARQERAEGSQA